MSQSATSSIKHNNNTKKIAICSIVTMVIATVLIILYQVRQQEYITKTIDFYQYFEACGIPTSEEDLKGRYAYDLKKAQHRMILNYIDSDGRAHMFQSPIVAVAHLSTREDGQEAIESTGFSSYIDAFCLLNKLGILQEFQKNLYLSSGVINGPKDTVIKLDLETDESGLEYVILTLEAKE